MDTHFKPDNYHRPSNIDAVSKILQEHGSKAKIIAGGTDLIINKPPGTLSLIDINGLKLDYIRNEENYLAIGPTTCFTKICESPLLEVNPLKVIKESAKEIGHHNLRHIATIGGNICNAVPSADSPIALIALDADAVIHGIKGERIIPLANFFKFVRETALERSEFLKEIRIPQQSKNTVASFMKIGRTKVDIALVNAACRLTLEDGIITDSRIVLGAVAPTPLVVEEAESMLKGKKLDKDLVLKVSQLAAKCTKPIDDVRSTKEYRREMSKVLIKRAITSAYNTLGGIL